MKKYVFCLMILLFNSLNLNGQKSYVLKGIVYDKQSSDTIPNVSIKIISSKIDEVKSNGKGFFFFQVSELPFQIEFSHPLYTSSIKEVKTTNVKNDTIEFNVSLVRNKTVTLDQVDIRPKGIPEKIFSSTEVSVSDFEVLPDGRFILLTYPKTLDKGSDVVLYDGKEIISKIPIADKAKELIHDFRGNCQIICENKIYGLEIIDNKITISSISKDYFFRYLAPIVDTNYTNYYLSDFNQDYPSMNYYKYDQIDSTYAKILNITDDFMLELYRAEYKWVDVRTKMWAKQKELETGIDAQIWVGANYFTQSIYYKKIYAPLFQKDDTLYVFDYYKDQLFKFNKEGYKIDSVAIFHHYQPKENGWKKHLIQDKITGKIYAHYELSGYTYLREIDLLSGGLKDPIRLKFRYLDKVFVQNDSVYYIYRPFESIQKKYLYKEKIDQ